MELLLFFFIFFSLFSSLSIIISKNPVYSIFYFILTMLNVSCILIINGAEYLGVIFLIVYIGAIAVLFLFVVMMLNIKIVELNETYWRYMPLGSLLTFVLFCFIFFYFFSEIYFVGISFIGEPRYYDWVSNIEDWGNIEIIGLVLYTYYFFIFILLGFILLLVIIGSIYLTLYQNLMVKRQEIFGQTLRLLKNTINLKK